MCEVTFTLCEDCHRETKDEDWDRCWKVRNGYFCEKVNEAETLVSATICPYCTGAEADREDNTASTFAFAVEDDDAAEPADEEEGEEYVVVDEDSASSSDDSDADSEDYNAESDFEEV